MSRNGNGNGAKPSLANGPARVRCAIYTRKSTTEGLDTDFTSLDNQREACEFFIRSQAAEGWEVIETRYDDGGYTGGNMDRPAFQSLMTDVGNGLVDQIVVYKVDRLSRSLMDFSRIMERLDRAGVGFVSVTQQFNTTSSMGRLTLNILFSFAQFERELTSERTRDKIAAARRRGKWTGGFVPLGYTIDHELRRLVVVPAEADLVRSIFELYLRLGSLTAVANRLNDLGYRTKKRETARHKGGKLWTKQAVSKVLNNILYTGCIRAGEETVPGEHEAVIEEETFHKTQAVLEQSRAKQVRCGRNPDFLLTGLLVCGFCGSLVTSASGHGRNGREYRYYRCARKSRDGSKACPSSAVSAERLEAFVAERIAEVAADERIREAVQRRIELEQKENTAALAADREDLTNRLTHLEAEARSLLAAVGESHGREATLLNARLGEIEQERADLGRVLGEIDRRGATLASGLAHMSRMLGTMEALGPAWEALIPAERRELILLLVRKIVLDQSSGEIRIEYHALNEQDGTTAAATAARACEEATVL